MRAALALLLFAAACGTSGQPAGDGGALPDGGGGGGDVNSAAAKYPDLRTLWARSVARTCGPNSGVCHDNRQFPDLQTASGLLDAVNKRCNQIRDNPLTVDNLCEPDGDTLKIGAFATRIGKVTPSPAMAPTTLKITLHDPISQGASGAASIVRQLPGLPAATIAIPAAAITAPAGASVITLSVSAISDPKLAPAPGGSLLTFLAPTVYVPGDDRQVVEGDPNGDGVFGHDLGGALIKPGDPMKSYLFLRVIAPLALGPNQKMTNLKSPALTEAQMPIANFQYWDIDNDTVALWCWIATMKPDGSNADGPIDYARCDTSAMPKPMHQGGEATTFSAVWSQILEPTCAKPCHRSGSSQPTRFHMDDLQSTYDQLLGIRGLGPSESKLNLPFVTKADPAASYLFLKVSGDPRIEGVRMPMTGDGQGGTLPPDAIKSIEEWIAQGANND